MLNLYIKQENREPLFWTEDMFTHIFTNLISNLFFEQDNFKLKFYFEPVFRTNKCARIFWIEGLWTNLKRKTYI